MPTVIHYHCTKCTDLRHLSSFQQNYFHHFLNWPYYSICTNPISCSLFRFTHLIVSSGNCFMSLHICALQIISSFIINLSLNFFLEIDKLLHWMESSYIIEATSHYCYFVSLKNNLPTSNQE